MKDLNDLVTVELFSYSRISLPLTAEIILVCYMIYTINIYMYCEIQTYINII